MNKYGMWLDEIKGNLNAGIDLQIHSYINRNQIDDSKKAGFECKLEVEKIL